MPLRVSRRVAVIGGGSSGVVAARFLLRAGHRPTVFEAGPCFGGVWSDVPVNTVVYRNLVTNLPKQVMQSPDLDFPDALPSYINKQQLGSYIARYADEFGVTPVTSFGSRVISVSPVCQSCDCAEERWDVRWVCDGAECGDTFDCVAVANGHYAEPYVPMLPGQEDWLAADPARSIIHSRSYDEPSPFRNQVVLVVGGRSSAVDISRSLVGVARWLYVLDKGCLHTTAHPQQAVTHVPLGAILCGDGHLRLPAASSGECHAPPFTAALPGPPIQSVILATGFLYSFPFLVEENVGMSFHHRRRVTPLYLHMQHARRPSLAFIGIQLAVPCPIPFFECQAAYLAEVWAQPPGSDTTTLEERCAWVEDRLSRIASSVRD